MTTVRLRRPAPPVLPARLDAEQQAAVDRWGAGEQALVVLGAAGTGKTTVAVAAAVAAVHAGHDPRSVVLMAPSRRAAAGLRDQLSAAIGGSSGVPMVCTPASLAYSVVRTMAAAAGEPLPSLVTGPEQDLVLAELLAGHAEGDGAAPQWADGLPVEATRLRSFRAELRDLLMRAAELGLDPAGLAAAGRAGGRAQWVPAARVYDEYLAVMGLAGSPADVGLRLDPAVLLDEAIAQLSTWSTVLPDVPPPSWDLVIVDDYHEATPAVVRLVEHLAATGRVLLLADPDSAVQTFRGADPALALRATAPAGDAGGALGAGTAVLRTRWRCGQQLSAVADTVAERIGTVGSAAHRRPVIGAAGANPIEVEPWAGDPVTIAVVPSRAQEAALIAHALRSAHVLEGVPWGQMAVLSRTGGQVAALRQALAAADVPVASAGQLTALRAEPVVTALLEVVDIAVADELVVDVGAAARLLSSPLIGADSIAIRRLRRALRAEEVAGGGQRSSDVLLAEAATATAWSASIPAELRRPITTLATVLRAAWEAAHQPGSDARTVLWAAWEAAGVASSWRSAALAAGPSAARADHDLDVAVALFTAAEGFDERRAAGAAAFGAWVRGQDLPADTLARSASRDAVDVLTAAQAAGREWQLVVVAGVQDGVWPDLRLRDTVLGAAALADLSAGRDGTGTGEQQRTAVLHDELRTFQVAVSRARRSLLVTAVSGVDDEPSPFVAMIRPDGGDETITTAPEPLDLRGLVAGLRSQLEDSIEAGAIDQVAAALLASLAKQGVPGADPATWAGVHGVSSIDPIRPPGVQVTVSPSKVELAEKCALRWSLEAAGGVAGETSAQSVGTLVHAIAAELPDGTGDQLRAELDRRWAELGLGDGWWAGVERSRAEEMMTRLAARTTATTAIAVETPFEVEIGRARLRGSIDRIERVDDTAVTIVDLKTGKSIPAVAEAATNAQLLCYQLAVDAGAVPSLPPGVVSAGAELVYLSAGVKGPTLRRQLALGEDGREAGAARIAAVAEVMSGAGFVATPNPGCRTCGVRTSCPAQPEGAQVVS